MSESTGDSWKQRMIRRLRWYKDVLHTRAQGGRPWHADLCEYYGVSPHQAFELGFRRPGRRPELPSSPTTHSVTGQTFEELWEGHTRDAPLSIQSFYSDVGAWFSFRQVVYHRRNSFRHIVSHIKGGDRICEYGAGVGPMSYNAVKQNPDLPLAITITDVPSEHLRFGEWRLRKLIDDVGSPATLEVLEVKGDELPLTDQFDIVTILDVLEHVHNARDLVEHLCSHLKTGGHLWETFIVVQPGHADLQEAQAARESVYSYLSAHMEMVTGRPAAAPGGGGARRWRKPDSTTG